MRSFLPKLSILLLLTLLIHNDSNAQIGTWTKVATNAPHSNMGVCLLMTDGTVICKNNSGAGEGTGWDKLTPNATGSYVNGTWSSIASMNNDRLFFSSQVLPSGKVYVAGGEYGSGTAKGEVYDPVTNTWTLCGAIPAGWKVYDGNSEILYNGNVLEGPQIGSNSSYNILMWSPTTLAYTTEANAPLNHDEAAWLKLPDSTVLYIGINSQNSCRYLPQTNSWLADATTPNNVYDQWGEEAGCAIMLPNGQAIFFGSTKYNAIYTPTGKATPGTWTAAANFPTINSTQMGQVDAPGAMMVNGHILLGVGPGNTGPNDQFRSPIFFVEYDYTTNTFTQVTSTIPGIGTDSIAGVPSNFAQFLDLPDGTVLMSVCQEGNFSKQYWVYTPGSGPIAEGKPTINSIIPDGCPNYKITGKLFNGISEGAGFGDDWQMETNYPLVRLTSVSGNVYYAKTTNWNRIGALQTDSLEDTAVFTTPAGLTPGTTYSLVVTVNGFASNPVLFTTLGVSASDTNPLCNGGTGNATALSVGGFSPYTYLWSGGGGTNITATGLSAGTYNIKVTDINGCTATASVTITQPVAVTAITGTPTNELCNGGNTGSVDVTATGGTSPYIYSWTPSGGTNATGTGLTAGTYTVTVKDGNGCTATASAAITQPTAPSITIATHTNIVPCNGDKTASAIANAATGGTSPYTYNWSSGGGTNLIASNLSAGTYTITAKDNNGCTATASVVITQPAALAVVSNLVDVNSTGPCNGEASVNVSGGKAPYTYSWTPGGGTNDTINGKCAGSYCCTITDNDGCMETTCLIIKNITGIANISNSSGINIYPNPSNGSFAVSGVAEGQVIELYNALGQEIMSKPADANATVYFNIATRADGLYLIRILDRDDNLILQKKILKVQ